MIALPPKQGLKQDLLRRDFFRHDVMIALPPKQGLKQHARNFAERNIQRVMIALPPKQGLKQSQQRIIKRSCLSYDSTSTKTRIETGLSLVCLASRSRYDSTSTKTRIETED